MRPLPSRRCSATTPSRASPSRSIPKANSLTVEDNGIGMSRDEMIEALGTIARSGTKAFLERIEAAQKEGEGGEATR